MDNAVLKSEKLSIIPQNERFICMFSGGKDSALAYALAREKAIPYALIHCQDGEKNISLNHLQDAKIVDIQAKAMNISICYYNNHWTKWPKLIKLYDQYKKENVKFVVFGDTSREDNVKLQITLCESSGLIPCFPLWGKDYNDLIKEIEKRKIKSVISSINDKRIGAEWLGQIYSIQAYNHFSSIGINPFGENSEFHTTLIDADFFNYPIKYSYRVINDNRIEMIV